MYRSFDKLESSGSDLALSRLVLIRWGIAAAEIAAISISGRILNIALPNQALFALVFTLLLTNGLLLVSLSSVRFSPKVLFCGTLLLDSGLLTALLYYSGGVVNPFTVLYLLYITLAAVVLTPLWSYLFATIASACFGGLFLIGSPVMLDHSHHMHGGSAFSLHLVGMWIAFSLTAYLIAYFISGLSQMLSKKERKLQEMRVLTAKQERLASLTTLAAGAAHELATPLSTIALVAKELERTAAPSQREDTSLIRSEVDRCRKIIDRMSGRVSDEECEETKVSSLIEELRLRIPVEVQSKVILHNNLKSDTLPIPPSDLVQILSSVTKNSIESLNDDGEVQIFLDQNDTALICTVVDTGHGIAPEILSRIGEPFFTTKEVGKGMGLGIFLVRLTAERLGGEFKLSSSSGGTTVKISLPLNRIPYEHSISSRS